MDKPLAQITFEFSGSEETEIPNNSGVGIARIKPKEKPAAEPAVTAKKTGSTRGRRSLKDIGLAADLIQVPEDEILFQKQYYSIGQVATWFRVNQSLVRYWETEFDILEPRKNRKGDRFFRPIDVKISSKINVGTS